MNEPEVMYGAKKRKRRTVQLTVALVLFVAVIFAATFIKLPEWLPALK